MVTRPEWLYLTFELNVRHCGVDAGSHESP